MVLCMKQQNGQYAFSYCYNPGVTIGSDHLLFDIGRLNTMLLPEPMPVLLVI